MKCHCGSEREWRRWAQINMYARKYFEYNTPVPIQIRHVLMDCLKMQDWKMTAKEITGLKNARLENALSSKIFQSCIFRCRGKFVAPGKFFPLPYSHNVTNPNSNSNFYLIPNLNPNPNCCMWELFFDATNFSLHVHF